MDQDLKPALRRAWNADVFVSEFPYFQYAEDSPAVREWMDSYGCDDIWTIPDHVRESHTYRTDLVAVRLDYRAVERRDRLATTEPLISGEGWGQEQPRLRTFLNFRRDGPMTRDYYLHDHGLHGEPNALPHDPAERTFQWLTSHGFLTDTGEGEYAAAGFGTVFAAAHAVELKREPGEWRTALDQAARADVYADYLWVAMSEATVDRAIQNATEFSDAGVGLLSVSSSGVQVHVQADRCTPPEDADLLSRPYCERWNLNERVLKRWNRDR